jgi:hypothetical protein
MAGLNFGGKTRTKDGEALIPRDLSSSWIFISSMKKLERIDIFRPQLRVGKSRRSLLSELRHLVSLKIFLLIYSPGWQRVTLPGLSMPNKDYFLFGILLVPLIWPLMSFVP